MKWLVRSVVLVAACIVTFAVLSELLLDLGLEHLVNRDPRLELRYRFAWWTPGRVHVWGLALHGRGEHDEWWVSAARASGIVDLSSLRDRVLSVDELLGTDVSFSWRPADDGPEPTGDDWIIALQHVRLRGVQDVTIDGYRWLAHGEASGALVLSDHVDADLSLEIGDGRVLLGDVESASSVSGRVDVHLAGLKRHVPLDRAALASLDADASLSARVESLGFLDLYFEKVPWLHLDGGATIGVEAHVDQGRIRPGSRLAAATDDLGVELLSYRITGDGTLALHVVDEDPPRIDLAVTFGSYELCPSGAPALVAGRGFTVTASSPDTEIDRPFTGFSTVFDLPASDIVDLKRFDRFLPDGTVEVRGGKGQISGHLEADGAGIAHGKMRIAADGVQLGIGRVRLVTDLAMDAQVSSDLVAGRHDFSHTVLSIHNLGFESDSTGGIEPPRSWWGRIAISEGVVRVGSDPYLDAWIAFRSAALDPFLRVLADERTVPRWLGGLVRVPETQGTARFKLGRNSIGLGPVDARAGAYELRLMMNRRREGTTGSLFARYRALTIGLGFSGSERRLHLLRAEDWYREQLAGAP